MGIFSFLRSISDGFFDALKDNATKQALASAKKQKKSPVIKKMEKLNKQNSELDDLIKNISQQAKKAKKNSGIDAKKQKEYNLQLKKKNEDEKRNNLVTKYGKETGTKLYKKQFFVGMTYEMLKEIKSRHDKKTSSVANGKETVKLYYGKKKNRLGNDSFKLEITLKDGKVTGWKDLTNVGTRNK